MSRTPEDRARDLALQLTSPRHRPSFSQVHQWLLVAFQGAERTTVARCAKVARDKRIGGGGDYNDACNDIAAAIEGGE